jgi:amidase
MESLGAFIHDPTDLPSTYELATSFAEVLVLRMTLVSKLTPVTDFKMNIEAYMEDLNVSSVRTLEDLINFNDAHADIEFPPGQCCQEASPILDEC